MTSSDKAVAGEAVAGEAVANARNPILTLISLTRRLVEVISQENGLLRTRRPAEAKTLIEEKGRLAAAYAREMDLVKRQGGITAFGTAEQLHELKRETSQFHTILEEHHRMLERARAITEGMLKAVGEEVARRQQPARGYDKGAAFAAARQPVPASIALNEII